MRTSQVGGRGLAAMAAALVGVLALGTLALPPAGADEQSAGSVVIPEPPDDEKSGLADPLLRELAGAPAAKVRRYDADGTIGTDQGGRRVNVNVHPTGSLEDARAAVLQVAGEITGGVDGVLLTALIDTDRMLELERDARVRWLEAPPSAAVPQAAPSAGSRTQALADDYPHLVKTNAVAWITNGYRGVGVKIGIIDYFDGSVWSAVQQRGFVPAPAGTFCLDQGQGCNIWAGGSQHGVAVAEAIHDVAPRATIYIATVETAADHQAAVNWMARKGVRIISRSLSALYDGAGNGTGPMAGVADSAVSKGIAWFNSAGNSADGHYWRGTWQDAGGNGWLDFAPGQELMRFSCGYVLGLRWSDWAANRTDYDAYVFDTVADAQNFSPQNNTAEYIADANQATGAAPLEHFQGAGTRSQDWCDSEDYDYLAVRLYGAGSETAGDTLEFMVNNGATLGFWQRPYSATQPVSDSANPGVASVGAVDPPLGTALGIYSSRGPSNDGRVKPDFSAASNFPSSSYGGNGFNGTSAATPVAAAVAALVLQWKPSLTPAALMSWMKTNAMVERGPLGPDNDFGHGEVTLPQAPPKVTAPTKPGTIKQVSATRTTVTFRWGASTAKPAGYRVDIRKLGTTKWRTVGTTKAIRITASRLRSNTAYQARVRAFNAIGWSAARIGTVRTRR